MGFMGEISQVAKGVFSIDLQPLGCDHRICSYLVMGEKTILIETGPRSSIENLLKGIENLGLSPLEIDYIILTHIHLDHGGGAGTCMKNMPNAKLLVHPRGSEHVINPSKLWGRSLTVLGDVARMYGKPEPIPIERVSVAEEKTIDAGNSKLKIIFTPGHASHHLSLYEENGGLLFSGDAAGVCYNGKHVPINPTPFNYPLALESLNKLIKMNPRKILYTHFGAYGGARKLMRRMKDQMEKWYELVYDGVSEGLSLDEIFKRIVIEDEQAGRVHEILKDTPFFKESVRRSVEGFADFICKGLRNIKN